jgi:hypothetical protein
MGRLKFNCVRSDQTSQTLARLIETKLACGQGNARRMHKDFADVVELIAKHDLKARLLASCTAPCNQRFVSC